MGELGRAWSAVTWQAPSRELASASRGVDRRTVRQVRTAVLRGEAVGDPEHTRLAVATAREYLRGTVTNPWSVDLCWLLVVALAVAAVRAAMNGYAAASV